MDTTTIRDKKSGNGAAPTLDPTSERLEQLDPNRIEPGPDGELGKSGAAAHYVEAPDEVAETGEAYGALVDAARHWRLEAGKEGR